MWDLVRPRLERRFERVLVPALPGHLGGPPLPRTITPTTMVEAVERALDDAGLDAAVIAGNSLGGHVALQLAARGRATAVTAFAPAGGWDDEAGKLQTLDVVPTLSAMVADPTQLSRDTVAHILLAAQRCTEAPRMIEYAATHAYPVEPVLCPVRFVWGSEDKLLPWPSAGARYQRQFAHADWVILDGVGHCPQLESPLEAAELVIG